MCVRGLCQLLTTMLLTTALAASSPLWAQPGGKKDDTKKPKAGAAVADKPAPDKPAAETNASGSDEAKKFDAKLAEWKNVLKELRAIKVKYQTAPESEYAALQTQWNQEVAKGDQLVSELRTTGQAAYLAAPNADRQLMRFLVKLVEDGIARDEFEEAGELAKMLIENGCDQKEVNLFGGIAAFVLNDYEKVTQYLKAAQEANVSADLIKDHSDLVKTIAAGPTRMIDDYRKLWAREQEFRAAEAEKDDLPRVRLKTNKGDIVLELFENEAPETVGNFVSLIIEKKFYDGLTFHRVLPGFMAQGGCPKGTGQGGPGYEIYDEAKKENARKHFRGSLSMAKESRPDSGGSQFFLTFVPTPHLNNVHTVFGRVVEGMDVLAKIQRRNPEDKAKTEPDKIITAEVIRKRDHAYAPNKVQ